MDYLWCFHVMQVASIFSQGGEGCDKHGILAKMLESKVVDRILEIMLKNKDLDAELKRESAWILGNIGCDGTQVFQTYICIYMYIYGCTI